MCSDCSRLSFKLVFPALMLAAAVMPGRPAVAQTCGWSQQGSGFNGPVLALMTYDNGFGGGSRLFAGGEFTFAGTSGLAQWDGSSWSAVGAGLSANVEALAVFDDGESPPLLYVGSDAIFCGGCSEGGGIVAWDGFSLTVAHTTNSVVYSLLSATVNGSPVLYAGGSFTTIGGGVEANRIARWDGSSWSPLGAGIHTNVTSIRAMAIFDDGMGGGPALYAGGVVTTPAGALGDRIARWDGQQWHSLGDGLSSSVRALAVFDDGNGPSLYVGGTFLDAGGIPAADRIAKWDGQSWSAVGGGVNGDVLSLQVFDNGDGPALYAGGNFITAGAVTVNRLAKWNGQVWSAVGGGMNNSIRAMHVQDDGSGQVLYTGGSFTAAGGNPALRIARLDCQRPASTNLGCIPDMAGPAHTGDVLGDNSALWYRVCLNGPAFDAAHTFFDADTEGSVVDVSLALFDSNGQLIAADHDGGSGVNAQLSFGVGRRAAVGDGLQYDGRHGQISAAVYYIAVAPTGSTFGNGFTVNASGAAGGLVHLNIATNVNGTPAAPPVPPLINHIDYGTVAPGGALGFPDTRLGVGLPIEPRGVMWSTFEIAAEAGSGTSYLDIDFNRLTDTDADPVLYDPIAYLFDSDGNLVAVSDDDGPLRKPLFGFGAGTGERIYPSAPSWPFQDYNGNLPAGRYYMAIALQDPQDIASHPNGARFHVRGTSAHTVPVGADLYTGGEPVIPTPDCPADFDGNGHVQVPDIFAFLSAWFANDPSADIDGTPGIAVPDIFAFLSLWFAGCP